MPKKTERNKNFYLNQYSNGLIGIGLIINLSKNSIDFRMKILQSRDFHSIYKLLQKKAGYI